MAPAGPDGKAGTWVDPDRLKSLIYKLQTNYSFFSEMSEEEIITLLRMCQEVVYDKGMTVFRQGDEATTFYLVVSGEVVISIRDNELARAKPGHIFGEMALLESIPRTASAATAEKTVLFSLPAGFMSAKTPALAYKVLLRIAQQMSEKLRETNTHVHFT